MKNSHRALIGLLAFSAAACAQVEPPQQPVPEDARDRVFYSEETERVKPLIGKLARNVLLDQKEIWTSPFHMYSKDAGWWLLFGAGPGALIATYRRTSTALPNTVDQVSISRHVSNLGATRPLDKNGKGSFFTGGDSFPSGHAAESWALAAVVAQEYNKSILVPVTAYGLASLVSFSRLSGRKHFASDVVAGSAMGWLIGRYVSNPRRSCDSSQAGIETERIFEPASLPGVLARKPLVRHGAKLKSLVKFVQRDPMSATEDPALNLNPEVGNLSGDSGHSRV